MDNLTLSNHLEIIGSNLYRIRHTRDEKLESVALTTGIHRTVLSKIEHGRYDCLSLVVLLKILDYYHVSLADIITNA